MALDQTGPDFPYEKNMGFFDHIDELRKRLVRIALVVVIFIFVSFFYVSEIFDLIILSPFKEGFWGYEFFCKAGRYFTGKDVMCWHPPALEMQSQQIQGQFVSAFKISLVVSFIIAFPYLIHQIWQFIKPALSIKEIRRTRSSLFVVSLLFFTGVSFAYFFLVPLASNFLLSYSLNPQIKNIITVSSVTGFVTFMCLATGLVFELPVLIYVLARIGFVSSSFLKKYWRYAAIIIFIIAGIATPSPDIFSQLLLGLPLMLLYVLGIFIAKRVEKRREKEES
ncbi:MAG: twin-arginine translocase subunit TatC [Bacteroidetes bacterium]|jgi:sec-independent protein translocase protein TatC|nr:twin-arginine translocase subunit TatC [Bacteroidota bacterium]